jgi:hypothetical protein
LEEKNLARNYRGIIMDISHTNVQNNKKFEKEQGIAVMLALLILLVLSAMAVSISFISNIDFQTMSNFKRGQEAFLAAERCVMEAKKTFEITGIGELAFKNQFGIDQTLSVTLDNGATCRSGSRTFDADVDNDGNIDSNVYAGFVQFPEGAKSLGRPIKGTSLPSGFSSGITVVPFAFRVVGKDLKDEDPTDIKDDINTGVEIAVGIENFTIGAGSNVYN